MNTFASRQVYSSSILFQQRKKRMNRLRLIKLFAVVAFTSSLPFTQVSAQDVTLKTTIDSTSIYIGDQTLIHLDLSQKLGEIVQLPYFSDTITNGILVLNTSKPDTVKLGNDRIQIKMDYLVTSFDEGLYYIPPFKAISGKDTALSNDLGLKVLTFNVEDTTDGAFFDIKPVYSAPWVFADYFFLVLGIFSGIWIILLILIALKKYRNRKAGILPVVPAEPLLPADVEALQALESLKQAKLWQTGYEKEYYTRITDTLRRYLERRFNINAMEMTSSEIMDTLRGSDEVKDVKNQLRNILETADFVKFAKMSPMPDENESNLSRAVQVIKETRPVEKVEENEAQSEKSNKSSEAK